jgi:hypothetical protein
MRLGGPRLSPANAPRQSAAPLQLTLTLAVAILLLFTARRARRILRLAALLSGLALLASYGGSGTGGTQPTSGTPGPHLLRNRHSHRRRTNRHHRRHRRRAIGTLRAGGSATSELSPGPRDPHADPRHNYFRLAFHSPRKSSHQRKVFPIEPASDVGVDFLPGGEPMLAK